MGADSRKVGGAVRVRDTLTGAPAELRVGRGARVRMYLCGITAYDYSHIGHARTVIVFDVLRRYAEDSGAEVELVQNFTDVDDKIIAKAAEEGASAAEVSARYVADYHECFGRLNVEKASRYPAATEHVGEMLDMIAGLAGRGIAYAAKNGVYFSVGRAPGYGRLSGRRPDELLAGARVEVDEGKRSPLDFALWKFASGEPSWPSPWGRGRPGWHIECSAMSLKYLGGSFDVHGGGRDLVFPHHENEMAQSEAHTGMPLARIWMHVGMVTVGGEKMSKSLGNVKAVRDLLARWSPSVVRLFCLGAGYAKPIDYSEDLLAEHEALWDRTRLAHHRLAQCPPGSGSAAGGREAALEAGRLWGEFARAIEDDVDTRGALGALQSVVSAGLRGGEGGATAARAAALLPVFDRMLGVLGLRMPAADGPERERIEAALRERAALRDRGMYGEADRIRDELGSAGVDVEDGAGGRATWIMSDRPRGAPRGGAA